MRFVEKIDERIKKLQDLKRLVTDPDIASLLPEFLMDFEQRSVMPPPPPPPPAPRPQQAIEMPSSETTSTLVNDVVNGSEIPGSSNSLWSRRRA